MPPAGEKNLNPESKIPESQPEQLNSVPSAEVAQPEAPKEPAKENLNDQPSATVAAAITQEPVSASPAPISDTPQTEENDVPPADDVWVGAVDQVIEKTKDKPYEEEEEAEGLQIKYLLKRFGKILKRDK